MRRFISYFNALLLGVILGMIFVAIVDAAPLATSEKPKSFSVHSERKSRFFTHHPRTYPKS